VAAPSDAVELASGAVPPGTGDSSGLDVLSPASDSSVGDPVSACPAGKTRARDILVRRTALELITHFRPLMPSRSLVEYLLSEIMRGAFHHATEYQDRLLRQCDSSCTLEIF
jgi:hypothetical protein